MGAIAVLVVLVGTLSYGHCVELTQPGSMVVKPGQPLTISCKVSYSVTGAHTAWIQQPAGKALEWIGYISSSGGTAYKDSLKNKFTISRDTSSNTVFLKGSSLQTGDTAVYYCARYEGSYGYFDYWGKGTKVTVNSGVTSPPSVFPLLSCGSSTAEYVSVGCMAKNFMPDDLTFKWNKKGGAALADSVNYPSVQSDGKFTAFTYLKVKVSDWKKDGPYQCSAEHQGQTTKADVVIIEPIPPKPALLYLMTPSHEELKDNKTATFACFASEFYPEEHTFTWRLKETELNQGITTLPPVMKKNKSTVYSATSFLRLPENQWKEIETSVSCEFKHKAGAISRTAHRIQPDCIPANSVKVEINQPSNEELFLNNRIELSCNVTGDPADIYSVTWQADGKELVSNKEEAGQSQIHKLYVKYNEWTNGTQYTCIVMTSEKPDPIVKTYRRENGLVQKLPSVFIMAPTERASSNNVTLVCYAKGFYPKEVLFSWLADDKPMDRSDFQTTQVVEADSGYSAYSQLSISAKDWDKGIVFSCAVHHESAFNGITKTIVRTTDSISKKYTTVSLDLVRNGDCKA